ncbi:histidine kinase dimerization/phosphoacceptor domain -containing protein, partial [Roseivivax halodurans]|uniref:histidine kinase dimerization/phosphoacceptor domain -containing protein n=1 Tax=Roseivivax halodurans TaxID=93683 RepID=UPI00244E49C6
DPRMQDNPLCCGEPGLRFYAGAPLRTEDGLPLGTLCALDYEPGELTSLQRDTLRVLSRQVMVLLEARRALRTADVLRREVDHRVKNSLQSLSSFIRLQRRAFASEDAKLALSMVGTRIDALTHLHEQLYQTDKHQSVDLGAFIEKICGHLASVAPEGVTLELEAVPVAVSPQQAAAVGTYLNELIANFYKHGFPDGEKGVVRVRLHDVKRDLGELVCMDTGVGFPDVTSTTRTGNADRRGRLYGARKRPRPAQQRRWGPRNPTVCAAIVAARLHSPRQVSRSVGNGLYWGRRDAHP